MSRSRHRALWIWIGAGLAVLPPLLVLAQPRGRATLRLVRGFGPLASDPRVYFQAGAEDLAERVARALPGAISRVEDQQVLPLRPGFRVYVCASHRGFTRFIGQPAGSLARGIAFLRDIWVSPLAFDFLGEDTHRQTLAHELSHLHLNQHLGYWRRVRNVPAWFGEGLADFAAGTGHERISRSEAVDRFLAGRRLVPDGRGRLLLPRPPEDYGLSWPEFHAQSRILVEYLHDLDRDAFRGLVAAVLGGEGFEPALERAYHRTLEEVRDGLAGALEKDAARGEGGPLLSRTARIGYSPDGGCGTPFPANPPATD